MRIQDSNFKIQKFKQNSDSTIFFIFAESFQKLKVMKASQLITFLGGAFLGAIIALLLAPESGDDTREKIKSKLEEKGIKLTKEQLDEFIDSIKEKLNLKKDQEVIIDDEPTTAE